MKILFLLFIALSVILISCGDDSKVNPTSPVIKNTGDIIPLADGNEWIYELASYDNGVRDTSEKIVRIEESRIITYENEEVTAYRISEYLDGKLEQEEWNLVLGDTLISSTSLNMSEFVLKSFYPLSYEKADELDKILFLGNEHLISKEETKFMDKNALCIKLDKLFRGSTSKKFYYPGVGLVEEIFDGVLAPGNSKGTILTLKSYTLK